MKRLALVPVLFFVAPLALGACRDGPTAPEGSAFVESEPMGDIQVSLVSGGSNAEMTVTLDGSVSLSIVPGQPQTFSNITVGEHEVRLRNVDKRCLAEGGELRRVTVRAGQTESVYFFVRCGESRPWKPQT